MFFSLKNCLFIYSCAVSSLLHGLFSSSSKQGLLSSCVVAASLVEERRPWSTQASVAAACMRGSCGPWAESLHGTWDLLGSGMEPLSPTLTDGCFAVEPPGKPLVDFFFLTIAFLFCFNVNVNCLPRHVAAAPPAAGRS